MSHLLFWWGGSIHTSCTYRLCPLESCRADSLKVRFTDGFFMEGVNDIAFELPGFLTCFSDGSFVRSSALPFIPPSQDFRHGVATKDVSIDGAMAISARIFLPHLTSNKHRLPVVLYAHGGSYCVGDPATLYFHDFCRRVSIASEAIWISLRYRLAPEHPLPAAYEDGYRAFKWLQSVANGISSEPWLHEFGDLSQCFLAGESAGAALVFNVAMRLAEEETAPSFIKGLIFIHPGFHTEANRLVMRKADAVSEFCYRLALPEGSTLDHPWVNPLSSQAPTLSRLSSYPRVLLAVAERDFRHDHTIKVYENLKACCPDVVLVISKGKDHAFHIMDGYCEEAVELEEELAKLIRSTALTHSSSSLMQHVSK